MSCVKLIMVLIATLILSIPSLGLTEETKGDDREVIKLEEITVRSKRGIDHAKVPAVVESLTADDIKKINVVGVEDVVKYQPALYVRKLGQAATNAPLLIRGASSRMTPRVLVMADDLLLSNFLAGGHSYGPRWPLVAPEEIERIDVIYGPYSALYSGNALAGALIMTTKFPEDTHLSVKTTGIYENYKLYQSDFDLYGYNLHVSYGDQFGKWGLFLIADQLYYEEQPITFYNTLESKFGAAVGNPVFGGEWDRDKHEASRFVYGSAGPTEKLSNLFKVKLAYDIDTDTDVKFTLAYWEQDRDSNDPETYLTDSSGNKVYSGIVDTDRGSFNIKDNQFGYREQDYQDFTYALAFKRTPLNDLKLWVSANFYQGVEDLSKQSGDSPPNSKNRGEGTVTDTDKGWYTFDFKTSPTPFELPGFARHTLTAGYHYDRFYYDSEKWNASDWKNDVRTTLSQATEGKTQTHAIFLQDEWDLTDMFSIYLGGRYEWWKAFDGNKSLDGAGTRVTADLADRKENHLSPKFAVTFKPTEDWSIRLSAAWAYRFPTIGELFQEKIDTNGFLTKSNPDLKSEKGFSKDLTFLKKLGSGGQVRLSFYEELVKDVIWSQTDYLTFTTNYQNMDEVRTRGIEFAFNKKGIFLDNLDLSYSVAFTDSKVVRNEAVPDSEGKQFLRVPKWRTKLLVSYYPVEDLTWTVGGRYASRGYNDIDNSDTQGGYGGVDDYLVFDTKISYEFLNNWTASLSVDNLTDEVYFVSHPYARRTYFAELKYDY